MALEAVVYRAKSVTAMSDRDAIAALGVVLKRYPGLTVTAHKDRVEVRADDLTIVIDRRDPNRERVG